MSQQTVIKFTSTRTKESVVCPGVTYHLRKLTEGRRVELRKTLREANSKLREIGREQDKVLAAPTGQQDIGRYMDLEDEAQDITLQQINPQILLWGIKSIEGLEIDGNPLSIDDWAQFPSELFLEMINSVNKESGFTKDEEKNSSSPTTSGAPVGESQESSTAQNAKSEDIIGLETVPSTSLN